MLNQRQTLRFLFDLQDLPLDLFRLPEHYLAAVQSDTGKILPFQVDGLLGFLKNFRRFLPELLGNLLQLLFCQIHIFTGSIQIP